MKFIHSLPILRFVKSLPFTNLPPHKQASLVGRLSGTKGIKVLDLMIKTFCLTSTVLCFNKGVLSLIAFVL